MKELINKRIEEDSGRKDDNLQNDDSFSKKTRETFSKQTENGSRAKLDPALLWWAKKVLFDRIYHFQHLVKITQEVAPYLKCLKVKAKTGVHLKLVLEAEAFHLQVRLECLAAAGLCH